MSDLLTSRDQMGQEVTFPFPPKRIISLVPSQTEFLLDIGAPVVGRTKFCIYPSEKIKDIPIVGGTKNFRFDRIKELTPDLLIGNKEENYKEGVDQLKREFPVWMSDIYTLTDSYSMMSALGEISGQPNAAQLIISQCKSALEIMKGRFTGKVVYLIWKDPWMAAGKNTFIDQLLTHLGYENAVGDERYPTLTNDQIEALKPDRILFSSEPFPFAESHISEAKKQWPFAESLLADGELHSWYGSRLRKWSNATQ